MSDKVNYLAHWRLSQHLNRRASLHAFFQDHEDETAETFALLAEQINDWMRLQGFWESRNVAEKLMLITTEVAEACEGHRRGDAENLVEELADVCIRVLDLAGELELDLGRAIATKMRTNLQRARKHGKAY